MRLFKISEILNQKLSCVLQTRKILLIFSILKEAEISV